MPGIQLGGLASGLDTQGIIAGLVKAESIPMQLVQQRQQTVDQATQTLSMFQSRLATLQMNANSLSDPTGFASFAATSSDAGVVASVSGAPTKGSYQVQVNALAREQRTRSDAQASATNALNLSGTLDMTINGTKTTISVASTDTLTDVATKIRTSGARVSASVLFDGSKYMLTVTGLDTGAANAVTFAENGFSLGLTKQANVYQTAQDAALTVDGISVTRPTNSITGVINGVTLALTKTTASAATVSVSPDSSVISQKISAFVSAYNAVVSAAQSATGYGSTKPTNSELAGDSTLRGLLSTLGGSMTSAIPNTIGKYTTLASVGVSTTRDGTLTFDASKLSAALADDPNAVSKVFVTDPQNNATGVMKAFSRIVDDYTLGPNALLSTHIARMQSISRSLGDQVMKMQTNIDAFQARLVQEFSAMENQVSNWNSMGSALASLTNGSSGGK